MSEPLNGAELLARIKPTLREEGTEICLRPDLLDAWEEANAKLTEMMTTDAGRKRLAGGTTAAPPAATRKQAQVVVDLEEQIQASSIMMRMRQMAPDKWQALCDAHPPRKGLELDAYFGYNRAAVVDASIRECVYDPVFDDKSWADLVPYIAPSEWDELRTVALRVNGKSGGLPKSLLASEILDKPGAGSRSRRRGASAPESSTEQ